MDLLQHLEELACGINVHEPAPTSEDLSRWQDRFGYSEAEARDAITKLRTDISGRKISDDNWDLIRSAKEAEGYDRETYEHQVQLWSRNSHSHHRPRNSMGDKRSRFVLRLGGPFPNLDSLRRKVGISAELRRGYGEDGDSDFACIDGDGKSAVEDWLETNSNYPLDFYPVNQALKELCQTSSYPTLGIDSSLPQHRMSDIDHPFLPAQTEYPVWYFFYGTLMDSSTLQRCIGTSEPPRLIPASIKGGVMRTQQRREYNALVDGPATAQVDGFAYLAESAEQEDYLRYRETENYEVVRCDIIINCGETLRGLTSRFARHDRLDAD
ncbi:MAG: hypothetical protein Q9222_006710 [Ikaeria aurantiellina]